MKILLPVDGSDASMAAVQHVLSLIGAGLVAEVVLVNVQEPATLYEVVTAHDSDVLEHVRSEAGADLLAPAEALLDVAGVAWQSEVAGGQPATLLLELQENYGCEAIVMGARGVGNPDQDGLGGVTLAMLAHSAVPVTVVRPPATEGAAGEETAEG